MNIEVRTVTACLALSMSIAAVSCLKNVQEPGDVADASVEDAAIPITGVDLTGVSIDVHKDVGCTCCDGWMEYLRVQGATVTWQEDPQLTTYQDNLGIPMAAYTCHTGVTAADGYVIGGHVPVEAIAQLLEDQPTAIGIVVLGMPLDSPGMGGTPEDWRNLEVKLITEQSELLPFVY